MEMNQESEILYNFERDSKWFHEHTNELRIKGFTDKFVAVKDSKVVSSDADMNVLISSLEKKGENSAYLFIEFVHPEGTIIIL